MRHSNVFIFVRLCLPAGNALTFKSFDLESLFLVFMYIFGVSRSGLYIKVKGQSYMSVYAVHAFN